MVFLIKIRVFYEFRQTLDFLNSLLGNKLVMRIFLSLSLAISFLLINPVYADGSEKVELKARKYYSFPVDMETRVTKWDGEKLSLKVYDMKRTKKEHYPIGTEFVGHVIKHREEMRFMIDEYVIVQVDKVVLPDGTVQPEDLKFKVRPRRFYMNPRGVGNTVVGATALTLGIIFDATVVGLPISRGGFAVWNCVSGIHERPEGASRLKAGSKGFIAGAFYPLPHLLRKAYKLDQLEEGARVTIDKERKGRSVDATVRPPRHFI